MANILKNFLNGLNLGEDDDDDFDNEEMNNWNDSSSKRNRSYDDNNQETEFPNRKFSRKNETDDDQNDNDQPKPVKQSNKNYGKVVHMKSAVGRNTMELRVIRPKIYDDSREISDTLADGMPVVLNLEGLNADLAQRILDFTFGAVYAMSGTLQKVTSFIFVITPNNVSISGNFDEMLDGSVDLSLNTKYAFKE